MADDKVNLIESAILSQARQESKKIIDKANEIRKREIDMAREEDLEHMDARINERSGALRQETVKAVARVELEARHEILKLRNQKTDEIFKRVAGRLLQYAETDGYKTDMLNRAICLKDFLDQSETAVLVRERDKDLGDKIAKAIGAKEVGYDPSIKTGGFKLKNDIAHILIDETLDERLAEQQQWFLQNCGLKVT
ncbi:MAG: V-type ATP synthase subunit E family protein [Oscillospiraceae bacterium]|nr:V-type ATP synthase subunit E family protein [Oscillospiraceae bacterium]